MMLYQKIKTFFLDNKRRFAFIGAGLVIFIVGYGTGRFALLSPYINTQKNSIKPPNHTTSKNTAANSNTSNKAVKPIGGGDPACPVKGNVASKTEKKYYVAGDRGYAQVKPEQCFATEAEAVAAGFVGVGSGK